MAEPEYFGFIVLKYNSLSLKNYFVYEHVCFAALVVKKLITDLPHEGIRAAAGGPDSYRE